MEVARCIRPSGLDETVTGERQLRITIERAGLADAPLNAATCADAVRLIKDLKGQRDTTLSVEPEGIEEVLFLAVDRQFAVLGLQRPDGVFQFSRVDAGAATHRFTIGGQEADIEDRYLLAVESAASVVYEWTLAGEESSLGMWERQ